MAVSRLRTGRAYTCCPPEDETRSPPLALLPPSASPIMGKGSIARRRGVPVRGGRRREVQRVQRRVAGALGGGGAGRHLARHGYDGVEWRVDGEYHWRAATVDRDAARIKELCAAHGLEVAGLTSYVRPDQEAGGRSPDRRLPDARLPALSHLQRQVRPGRRLFRDPRPDASSSSALRAGSRAPGSRRCSRSISARSSRARRWPSSCCAISTRRPSA